MVGGVSLWVLLLVREGLTGAKVRKILILTRGSATKITENVLKVLQMQNIPFASV